MVSPPPTSSCGFDPCNAFQSHPQGPSSLARVGTRENPYHRRQRAQDGPEENNGREGTSEGGHRPTLVCVQLHKLRGANLFLATSSSTQTNSRSGRIYLRDCRWVFGVPGDSHAKVTLALHGGTIAVKRQAQQKAGQRARVTIANENTLQTWTEHSG